MTVIKEINVKSSGEFISYINDYPTKHRRLYRGQSVDRPLLPRIMRLAFEHHLGPDKIDSIEQGMLERFRMESIPLISSKTNLAKWELLSIAQHWGMPTRLLDWTENPLAAVWFTVSDKAHIAKSKGIVWMVDNPNEIIFQDKDNIFRLGKTCFFKPPHLDRRIIAQSAWFSVYRHNRTTFLELEKQRRYEKLLTRFVIEKDYFQKIRKELRSVGITNASIYPDLHGLAADIEAEYFDL